MNDTACVKTYSEAKEPVGYVDDCFLIPREGETMFIADRNMNPIPMLNGFVIMPKEQFLDDKVIENIKETIRKENK